MTPGARRLYQAGFIKIAGWVPAEYGETVLEVIGRHRKEVQQVLAVQLAAGPPAKKKRLRLPLTNRRVDAMRLARLERVGLKPRH
jgi:hypothetical protein